MTPFSEKSRKRADSRRSLLKSHRVTSGRYRQKPCDKSRVLRKLFKHYSTALRRGPEAMIDDHCDCQDQRDIRMSIVMIMMSNNSQPQGVLLPNTIQGDSLGSGSKLSVMCS